MSRGRAGKAGENWGVKALDYQDYAVGSAQMNDTVTLGLGWLIDPLGQDEVEVGEPKSKRWGMKIKKVSCTGDCSHGTEERDSGGTERRIDKI